MASALVLVTCGGRRELWTCRREHLFVPAVWRNSSLHCGERREQNSHCIAQLSAAVAALLVFIVNTSCGLVLATSAAHTATESIPR